MPTYPRTTVAAIVAGLAGGIAAAVITALVVTTLTIGSGGTAIDFHKHTSATIDPQSMAALGSSTSSVITVTGVIAGDTVIPTRPAAWADKPAIISGIANATDTVTLYFVNGTSTALDLASGAVQLDIWSH